MFTNWHDITKRPKGIHQGIVTTAQIDWELNELIRIHDKLAPMDVLEIGTQLGGTLYYWLEGAQPGATIVNIDILQNQSTEVAASLPDTWASWAPDNVNYHSIIGRSEYPVVYDQVVQYFPSGIDFLFIDGLHTYEGVKADFLRYGPMVRKGGVIALHDLMTPEFSPHIQVGRLWREIQEAGYITQELRAGSTFGGIGVVYL